MTESEKYELQKKAQIDFVNEKFKILLVNEKFSVIMLKV